jgi:hypothetical protein
MNKVKILELLDRVGDALYSMIGYADDGTIPSTDENYKDFFNDIKMAYQILDELENTKNYIKEMGVDSICL